MYAIRSYYAWRDSTLAVISIDECNTCKGCWRRKNHYVITSYSIHYTKLYEDISNLVDIHYIRQKEPRGLGHAIYCARKFIGNEPFAVLLGDDIVDSREPCLKQLIDRYNEYKTTILGVQAVPQEDVSKYGIISGNRVDERIYKVKDMIEKPEKEQAPSNIAILGRYIISPHIFEHLESVP